MIPYRYFILVFVSQSILVHYFASASVTVLKPMILVVRTESKKYHNIIHFSLSLSLSLFSLSQKIIHESSLVVGFSSVF